jgi:hypothetical protein
LGRRRSVLRSRVGAGLRHHGRRHEREHDDGCRSKKAIHYLYVLGLEIHVFVGDRIAVGSRGVGEGFAELPVTVGRALVSPVLRHRAAFHSAITRQKFSLRTLNSSLLEKYKP